MGREPLGRKGLRMQKRKKGRGVPITWDGDPEHRGLALARRRGFSIHQKEGVGAAWGHWAGTTARG